MFVGNGVTAPEYGWDDYAGVDMRGKTAVILINDPGFATHDASLFRGRAMTYYGRWTYKFEEAARRGAAAALIVHETEPAAYGWETVVNSGSRGFRAEPLSTTATASLRNAIRRTRSHNLAALLPGTTRANEYIVYMAHWDHLGRMPGKAGDNIFNGAVDNATGTAGLLAIANAFANAFAKAKQKPRRSLIFLAVTLEESGLLGSAYYADNPLFPLASTVAAMNMDAIHFGGPTRDVTVVGFGASELERYLAAAARKQRRVLREEPAPEKGTFFRSDHFNLARHGVPALYIKTGIDDRAHGAQWRQRQLDEFTARRYHQVGDECSPDADLRAARDHSRPATN